MALFSLPSTPAPYPGEILGHWLSRGANRFGTDSWLRFVRQYSELQVQRSFVDSRFTSHANTLLKRILEALGMNFEHGLATLTLMPYWSRFVDEERSQTLMNAPSFVFSKGRLALPKPRFCADCIRFAVQRVGEPYLFLKHQLPNVHGCDVHHLLLHDRCTVCGRIPPSYAFRSMEPMSCSCECGADFRDQRVKLSSSSAYWRLVSVSTEALGWAPQIEHRDYTAAFEHSIKAEYGQVAYKAAFFEHACAALALDLVPPLNLLMSKAAMRDVSAPQLCAYIALKRLTLSDGIRHLRKGLDDTVCEAPKRSQKTRSLADAKRVLIQRAPNGIYPGKLCRTPCYWMLRLFDPRWLESHFPASRLAIPSIASDRREILSGLASKRTRHSTLAGNSAARARLRDSEWFKATVRKNLHRERQQKKERKAVARGAAILHAAKILNASRQTHVSLTDFSRIACLTNTQVWRAFAANANLRSQVTELMGSRLRAKRRVQVNTGPSAQPAR